MTESDFDLRMLVRAYVDETSMHSIPDVARTISMSIPEKNLREALAQALPLLIRQIVTLQIRPLAAPRPLTSDSDADLRVGTRKRGEIRRAWERILDIAYPVPSGTKRFGDFTSNDLRTLAKELDREAEQRKEEAQRLRSLADTLEQQRIEHVRDLPEDVLNEYIDA